MKIIILSAILIFSFSVHASEPYAKIIECSGNAFVRMKSSLKSNPIQKNLLISEPCRIKIENNSSVTIHHYKNNSIDQLKGPVYIQLPIQLKEKSLSSDNTFTLRAPTAVSGVRSGSYPLSSSSNTRRSSRKH